MSAQLMTRRQRIQPLLATPLPSILGLGGALAGLAGGAAMIGSAALLATAYGYDVWFQLKVVASVLLGPAAHVTMGFDAIPVLVGLLVHLLVAAMLGAGFEIAAHRWLRLPSDYGMSAIGGLSFGLLIWLLAYLFVPMVAPYLMAVAAPAFIIQHLVYGTVTGLLFGTLWPQPYTAGV
jgi:hypothetical protein